MMRLQDYTADHRYLLDLAARQAGLVEPLAVQLDDFHTPLMKEAKRGAMLPVDGAFIRSWNTEHRRLHPGLVLGMRVYEIEGVRFVRVCAYHDTDMQHYGLDFCAVGRRDYAKLYKIALRCRREAEPEAQPPILPAAQADQLWKNTIGYLETPNLERINKYGGRARRGVLLTGPPGNGKTMACRWIWEECRKRNWEWRIVTPDDYREARSSCNAAHAVETLFTVEKRGVVFFDDMDVALRDRETVKETDDQAVFLTALDGIATKQGVVFVFTTNCDLNLIDRAFKRPGRIDLMLHFDAPDAALRRRLFDRWHADIRAALELDRAVGDTKGYSFAEIEELKNLLILRFMDTETWDWEFALHQFDVNRAELATRRQRQVGFGANGGAARREGRQEIPF
jgi:hypothetical protein